MQLSNNPPKGTSDWQPAEFQLRKYIFDTWRSVCLRFGFEEYLTPIFESADIYRAKSGEDIGGKELMMMTDKAGRELAIRPEMTPSVTRMISRDYKNLNKPVRYFSIANFVRNEKPQRGRNREFWQLNVDIFGSQSTNADLEMLVISLELILTFFKQSKKEADSNSFVLKINNRKLIEAILESADISEEQQVEVVRTLDKFHKLPTEKFTARLQELSVSEANIEKLSFFMSANNITELTEKLPELANDEGFQEITNIMNQLTELGYGDFITFAPDVIRGFDYYDGLVFEMFDNHPDNSRSLFGGGRYNGLAKLFGKVEIPAVGIAPGDETMKLFLEAWDLLPAFENKAVFIPLLEEQYFTKLNNIANSLREQNIAVEQGLEVQKMKKAFSYANQKWFPWVILVGEEEMKTGQLALKNMETGEQKLVTEAELIMQLQNN